MWIIRKINKYTGRDYSTRSEPAFAARCPLPARLVSRVLLFGLTASPVIADQAGFPEGLTGLDREVQVLKQEILEINRELLKLEEELLYPPDQQLVVFLSLSKDSSLTLQRVYIELDGEVISDHVYTEQEADALHRSGVHKPYVGRLDYGKHRLQSFVTGTRGDGTAFRQSGTSNFAKGQGTRYIELRIAEKGPRSPPELTIHGWQQ